MKGKKFISIGIIALMLFGAFTVLINTGTENVKAADDSGLVAYWDFDEGAGTVLHDQSGNGNDGTIYGATWVDGVKGKALSFDGIDNYVVSIPENNWDGDFTVIAWVKTENPYQHEFSSIFSSARSGPSWYYSDYPSHTDTFQLDVDGYGEFRFHSENFDTTIGSVTDREWQFIAATFGEGVVKTYLNGELTNSSSWNGQGIFERYKLGLNREEDCHFNGTIDEVHIYNRALSAEEIQSQYDEIAHPSQSGGSTPGFEAAYFIGALFVSSAMLYYRRRKP